MDEKYIHVMVTNELKVMSVDPHTDWDVYDAATAEVRNYIETEDATYLRFAAQHLHLSTEL